MFNLAHFFDESLKLYSAGELAAKAITLCSDGIVVGGSQLSISGKVHIFTMGKAGLDLAVKLKEMCTASKCSLGKVICFTKHYSSKNIAGIECYEGGHPIPDSHSFLNGVLFQKSLEYIPEQDTIIIGITGGGSSIIEFPLEGISETLIKDLNNQLVQSGASIQEINLLRGQVSLLKNGGVPLLTKCKNIIGLCLSDVPSGSFKEVSSNPLTYVAPSREVLVQMTEHYLYDSVKEIYLSFLESKIWNDLQRQKEEYDYANIRACVIGEAKEFLKKTLSLLPDGSELSTGPLSNYFAGGLTFIVGEYLKKPQRYLVSGGEFPVEVNESIAGCGGRNTHFTLACALELENRGINDFFVLSFGTDGDDGNTGKAGSYINNQILQEARNQGIKPEEYLQKFDSCTFFNLMGCSINGTVTNTNVMDLRVIGKGPIEWRS